MSEPPRPVTDGEFDLTGPLPPAGITVLEASAGTGKTYALAGLASRYVAEGVRLDSLLLATFTRQATGELRQRVRERLALTEQALLRALDGESIAADDGLLQLLCSGSPRELELRRERLTAALTDFDAATIETTHSFCQRMLAELGTLGDLDPDVSFLDRPDTLLEEVVDDLYTRAFQRPTTWARPIGRETAIAIARAATQHPTATIYPEAPRSQTAPVVYKWLAEGARTELARRKRALAVMTPSDQLTRLLDVLKGANGELAAARLRERFKVVLIDEFQDTDPVQWEILRLAFATESTRLVLIGDPKQAIYAFRGADVYTYLAAARRATRKATLVHNYRSDAGLLTALNALFGNAHLGHPEIPYRPLLPAGAGVDSTAAAAAAPDHTATGAATPAPAGSTATATATQLTPVRIRVVGSSNPAIKGTPSGRNQDTTQVRAFVARDAAGDIAATLADGTSITGRGSLDGGNDSEGGTGGRQLAPGDIAVLVRTHAQARMIQDELTRQHVPAVIAGAGSVFATEAATDWQCLLQALERPADRHRAAAAALSVFIGWDAAQLARADEEEREQLHLLLHRWARILRERGVAALIEALMQQQLAARLLARPDGDRRLTDIQHIGELLHAAISSGQLGLGGISAWLRQRLDATTSDRASDELTRRLDTDAAAVHVMTIHASKGLEFPIVYCPYLWDGRRYSPSDAPASFHTDDGEAGRAIDVALEGVEFKQHAQQQLDEERGEELRLAYVAVTRARHQAVLWWAGGPYFAFESPLGRLLFACDADGNVSPRAPGQRPTPKAMGTRMRELVASSQGTIGLEAATPRDAEPEPTFAEARDDELALARLDRSFDASWRRISYSAIVAGEVYDRGDAINAPAVEPLAADDEVVVAGAAAAVPAPGVPAPGVPAPGVPAPGVPAPGVPAPGVPAPGVPAPGVPANGGPSTGTPSTSTPPPGTPPAPGPDTPMSPEPGGPAAGGIRTLPLATMPAGALIGTIVHRALELVEFDAADLEQALAIALDDSTAGAQPLLGSDLGTVAAGLALALRTPLGGELGPLSLRELPRRDRLDELQFELPLAGGERPLGSVTLAAIATAVKELSAIDDPLRGYAERLRDPALVARFRGFLTGRIDLIARTDAAAPSAPVGTRAPAGAAAAAAPSGDAPTARFHVIDYKTNWLAAPGEPLTAERYRPAALNAEMQRSHYVLQALLYEVALHRYLRWRLPGYAPERNLGGVHYLFLRGMTGPSTSPNQGTSTGETTGIFNWQPTPALIMRLSEVLDGE
jgi:exodeoxyribonuclease V beta subunit